MRLNEIYGDSQQEIDDFVNHVKNDCKPFLSTRNGFYLYHGNKYASDDIMINEKIRNRKGWSDERFVKELSKLMKQDGYVATRDNSLFCVLEKEKARGFSGKDNNVFYIFPIGEANYTWFDPIPVTTPNIFYNPLTDLGNNNWVKLIATDAVSRQDIEKISSLEVPKIVNEFWRKYEKYFYHTKQLFSGIKSEIMVNASGYHGISVALWNEYNVDVLLNEKD